MSANPNDRFLVTVVDAPHRETLFVEIEFCNELIAEVFEVEPGRIHIEWMESAPFEADFFEFHAAMARTVESLQKFGFIPTHGLGDHPGTPPT